MGLLIVFFLLIMIIVEPPLGIWSTLAFIVVFIIVSWFCEKFLPFFVRKIVPVVFFFLVICAVIRLIWYYLSPVFS